MQTIWSRAAQTRCTCRCPSCVFTKAALARRQVATARRFLLKPLQSATFTYSAIFAGATLIDGKLKLDRRKELENAITEAKERLEEVQHLVEEYAEEAGLGSFDEETTQLIAKEDSGTRKDEVEEGNDFSWQDLRRYEIEGNGRPQMPRTLGQRIDLNHLPPQSFWAPVETQNLAASTRWSDRKLRMNELVLAQLILDILISAGLYNDGMKPIDHYPGRLFELGYLNRSELIERRKNLDDVLEHLKWVEEDAWESSYATYSPFFMENQWIPSFVKDHEDHHLRRWKRNWNLYNAFEDAVNWNQSFGDIALRLCASLVTSSQPDHVTYNILLMGLSKLRLYGLVDRVCDLMDTAKIRPNELTCALVLDHFTRTNNATGFSAYVDKMRGLGNGLMLARPELPITELNSARLVLKDNTSSRRKVIQKVVPTPMVYNSLVSGLIRFLGVDNTLKFCQELQGDGWGVDKRVLGQFMSEYAKREDWDGCVIIWDQYQKLAALTELEHVDYSISATMLELCLSTKRDHDFNQLFSGAVSNGFNRFRLQKLVDRRRRKSTFVPMEQGMLSFGSAFDLMTRREGSRDAFMSVELEAQAHGEPREPEPFAVAPPRGDSNSELETSMWSEEQEMDQWTDVTQLTTASVHRKRSARDDRGSAGDPQKSPAQQRSYTRAGKETAMMAG